MKKIERYLYSLFFIFLCLGQGQKIPPIFPSHWLPTDLSIYFSDFAALLIAVIFIYRLLSGKSRLPSPTKNHTFLIFLAFIGSAIVSLLANLSWLNPKEIFLSALYLLRFLIYLISILSFITERERVFSFFARPQLIATGGLLVALIGLIQFFLFPDMRHLEKLGWDAHYFRLTAPFLDPDFTGIILVLFFLFILEHGKKIKQKNILLAIIGLAIILTFSRASLLSLGIGAGIICFFQKKIKTFLKIMILILIFTASVSFFLQKSFGGAGTDMKRITTVQARIEANQTAIILFLKRPLLGIGFNTYPYAKNKLLHQPLDLKNHSRFSPPNSLLLVLATTGMVGFSFFLLLIRQLFLQAKKTAARKSFLLLAVLNALLVHSLFSNTLFHLPTITLASIVISFKDEK